MTENSEATLSQKNKSKRKFFDIVFFVGFLCCLVPGAFPGLTSIASIVLLLCIAISFFDENFYIYLALFMYMRYKMLLGDTPAFRLYSYMVVLRFLIELPKVKLRITFLPALVVFLLHSLFATAAQTSIRIGLNVIVDCVIAYIVLLQLAQDDRLMRKYIFAFLLGGVTSGVFGWTSDEVAVDINVSGAGAQTVNRNFGALSDANFAGLFYSMCIICSVALKKIPLWLRVVFIAIFSVVLLQTASLSAILTLGILGAFMIVLKFRMKSVFILSAALICAVVAIAVIMTVPQLQEIDAIAGLVIRIKEKLSYIPRGRWDLLTTDRWSIWGESMDVFFSKQWWGKLVGGSVVTVMYIDESIFKIACHNSYIQSILNFGILGTLVVYLPLLGVFIYRLLRHFTTKKGYETEDIKIIQLVFVFSFLVFGMTVDFYIDWPFMMFYFI